VTRDPENGTYNVGTYRGMVKSADRIGLQMDPPASTSRSTSPRPVRPAVRCRQPSCSARCPLSDSPVRRRSPTGPVSTPSRAGSWAGRLSWFAARGSTLKYPRTAEVVIEGEIDPTHLESEGPFGEASGYMGPRTSSPVLKVFCITHRRTPIVQAFISEFPPSESTLLRKIAFENLYLRFLRGSCNIDSVRRVVTLESAPATCLCDPTRQSDTRAGAPGALCGIRARGFHGKDPHRG